jgi:LysR family transcriptional regulator, glycine cleavage system transcriptional activator
MPLPSSTLASVRFFAVAARLLSFKRAAAELHVTQGAVSQHIRHLEEVLRCRLFIRLPRHVALTDEGKRFASIVQQALEDIERGADLIKTLRSPVDIRLRTGPSFALRWLVPRLRDFYAHHSGIRVFVNAVFGVLDPEHCDFDLAIESVKGKISGMHSEFLMEEYLVPVCTPRYLEQHEFLRRPKDLERCILLHDAQPWVGATEDAEWRSWLTRVGIRGAATAQGRFFSLANMALEAALTHQGVALGRTSMVKELLERGELVMPIKQVTKSPASHWIVYRKEVAKRPGVQSAIQWLHEQASQTDRIAQ